MSGTIVFDPSEKVWRVDAAPHVLIRLRRIFAKSGRAAGAFELADTEENARDLLWVTERYEFRVTPPDYLEMRSRQHVDQLALVEGFLARRVDPPTFDLALPPREYQRVAAGLALTNRGLLLADDLGLGKTASAICMISDPRARPALVVTMTHLPRQWERELARFAPQLRVHVVKKGKPYDLTAIGGRGKQLGLPGAFPDVVVLNYHKLAGWADTLAPLVRSVIYDECQELRSGLTREVPAKYQAARFLAEKVTYRLGLSATPIYNYGSEFFAVVNALAPGKLGTFAEFKREWCVEMANDRHRIKDTTAFGTYLRESGLMLRRTRADVGRELPQLTKVPHVVEADETTLAGVSDACVELARVILAQGEKAKGDKMRAAEELSNKLRQATGIAKAPSVAAFVRMVAEGDEPVVVFAWHREVYSILCDKLADLEPALYTGTESPAEKERARERFVTGKTKVLLMSLRSGAGLDGLQAVARTCIFAELDWSPGVHEQCIGRVHRDGQKEPVVAYYLTAETGSDPSILEALSLKREQIEGVRNLGDELLDKLDVDGDHIKKLAATYLAARGEAAA